MKISEFAGGAVTASLYAYKDFSSVKHLSGKCYAGVTPAIPVAYRPLTNLTIVVPVLGLLNVVSGFYAATPGVVIALV